MNTSKVKPTVGQVWEISPGRTETARLVNDFDVHWVNRGYATLSELHENFTFIPQNDLEWLAIDSDAWKLNCKFIFNHNDYSNFCSDETKVVHDCYTRQQWQDKRYELGLDERKGVHIDADGDLSVDDEKVGVAGDKPVYTQEQADAGELPPVGSYFIVTNLEYDSRLIDFLDLKVEVIGHCDFDKSETVVTFKHPVHGIGCGTHGKGYNSWAKPIQTDEEKAIDDLSNLVGDCESDWGILKAIKAGKIHGVKWVGE